MAIDYAERILRIQRGRNIAYTALFHCCENEKIIRWMKVSPGDGHYVTEVSRPESLAPLGLGQRQLLTMLSKTSEEGRTFPKLGVSDFGEKIEISYALGHGATADVYLGSVGAREGVLKVLKSDFMDLADHEASTLVHLLRVGTPFLSNCTKIKDGVLFFDEILRPVQVLTPRHVAGLLTCLEHAHNEAKMVHRDIRPDNIMEGLDDEIRIIDWGFAHVLGATTTAPAFQGTFRFACDDVLDAAIIGVPRVPKPEDDLESFVRVVFAMANRTLWNTLSGINDGDFAEAKHLWGRFKEENPRQADMFNAAANLDYEALKHILPGLRPISNGNACECLHKRL